MSNEASELRIGGALDVTVDLDVCQRTGMCTSIAPEIFDLDRSGTLVLVADVIALDQVEAVRDAAACCPTEAISTDELARSDARP